VASTNGFTPEQINTILFDLDGTLRYSQPTFYQAFFNVAFRLGAPDTPGGRWRMMHWLHYYWAQSPALMADIRTYPDHESFWINHARLALLELGCTTEEAGQLAPGVYQEMEAAYRPGDWVPPDVPETLEALKKAGYHLAVVSNRNKPYQEQLESLGLAGYFEFSLAAGEVDSWKPDPGIFLHAIQRLGVQPCQVVYVGDNYYADVLGAQRAGLYAVLLDSDQLFPEAECKVISQFGALRGLLTKDNR
jgi:HAD superfamily hydrolase (TIGR01549 family)